MAVSDNQGKQGVEDTPTSNDALLNNGGSKTPSAKKRALVLNKKGDVICTVTMLDGHDMLVELPKSATGQDLLDKVCSNLQLLEKDWFSCIYKQDDVKYWLNHERRIGKQLKNQGWDFSFQVKFYPSEPKVMTEDLTRYQLFLQVRTDVYTGKLPCSFVTYSLLGSYAAQSEFGDFDPQEVGTGIQYLKDAAPYAPQQPDELLERISELHKNHGNLNPGDAEMAYLENAKVLSLYGVDLHRARDEGFSDVMVGVCSYGLNIYKERLRVNRFPWAKILKIAYKRCNFYVKNRAGENEKNDPPTITYKLPNHKLAKRLWKTAVEHHAFFRLEKPVPARKGMFPLFSSRFRYSGRTLHQARNAFQDLDRKTPTIDRAASRRYAAGANKPYDTSASAAPTFSTDRVEEVMMPQEHHTNTLDIKSVRKNRSMATPTEEVDHSFNEGAMQMGEGGDFSNVSYSKGTNNNTSGYGAVRYDQYGNPISNGLEGPYGGDNDDAAYQQEDHQQQTSRSAFGGTSTTTTTRTITTGDGSVVTEREQVTETRIGGGGAEDFDHDQALHDAIFAVTDMNQDLSVQKIEIQAEK